MKIPSTLAHNSTAKLTSQTTAAPVFHPLFLNMSWQVIGLQYLATKEEVDEKPVVFAAAAVFSSPAPADD